MMAKKKTKTIKMPHYVVLTKLHVGSWSANTTVWLWTIGWKPDKENCQG